MHFDRKAPLSLAPRWLDEARAAHRQGWHSCGAQQRRAHPSHLPAVLSSACQGCPPSPVVRPGSPASLAETQPVPALERLPAARCVLQGPSFQSLPRRFRFLPAVVSLVRSADVPGLSVTCRGRREVRGWQCWCPSLVSQWKELSPDSPGYVEAL